MPTFMLFKNGKKVQELVGANPSGLQVGHYACRYAPPPEHHLQNLLTAAV